MKLTEAELIDAESGGRYGTTLAESLAAKLSVTADLLERAREALIEERSEAHNSTCWCDFGKKNIGLVGRPKGHSIYCIRRAELMLALDSTLR